MIKICAKLVKNHKTVKQYDFININEYNSKNFYSYLVEICNRLDITTPVVIDYHIFSYEKYNYVKFKSDDFVDDFKYDFLLIENIDL